MTHHSLPVESDQHNDEQEDDHSQPNHPHIIGNTASKHSVVTLHEDGEHSTSPIRVGPEKHVCVKCAMTAAGETHAKGTAYLNEVMDCLSKSDYVQRHCHRIGEGKDDTNGPSCADRITPHHITSQHITYHITSQHIISHHRTPHPTTSHHITEHHTTPHHSKSQHTTAQHSTPHHTTSHHSTLHKHTPNSGPRLRDMR